MNSIKISVIIPSYNQGPYIENCIKSVLGQTYSNYELIIADGASKDNTKEVCEFYAKNNPKIHFFSEPDKGFADAVNKAILKSVGELCIIQSSDDFFSSPNVFAEAIELYRKYPEAVIITGQAIQVDESLFELDDTKREVKDGFIEPDKMFSLNYWCNQGSTFFSRERAIAVDLLRLKHDMVADTDFWVRMAEYKPRLNNMVYLTNLNWNCVTVQPDQRSADRSKFVLATSKLFYDYYNDDKFAVDKQMRFETAVNNINYGLIFFAILGKSLTEHRLLFEQITGRPLSKKYWVKLKLSKYKFFKDKFFRNFNPVTSSSDYLKRERGKNHEWFKNHL